MKANSFIIRLLSAIAALCLLSAVEAGSPLWTFAPLTATTLSVPSNGTATVQYQVTNQSSRVHTLAMNAITGVTQNTGGGYCGNPFSLSYHQSCVLNLAIDGRTIPSSFSGGPVVCQQGSGLQCYQPNTSDALNIIQSEAVYTVGGTVNGLSGTVILENNGGDSLTITADGTFAFATSEHSGDSYAVTVQTQPNTQTCTVSNGSGTMGSSNVTNVSVTCATNSYTVGGTVSGLAGGQSTVLQNNGADNKTISASGAFTFTTSVAQGATYSITVLTQPSTQTCTITNGSGTMGGSNVANVSVTCVTNSTTLATSVSNLALSKTGYTEYGLSGTPSSGLARTITVTNTGSYATSNLSISYPAWPSGTTASSNCGSSLAASATCTITITPGNTATSDGTNPCTTTGTAPVAQTISISADNASTVSSTAVILGYGCIYQGGYVYALDDTSAASTSVGGNVATTSNQSAGIIWSSNGSGGTSSIAIYGISETSTALSPNPISGQVSGQTACQGNKNGSCDTNNIYVYYQTTATNSPISTSHYATGLCKQTISTYSDWYLPAICEMGYGSSAACGVSGTPTLQNMQSDLVDTLNLLSGVYWSSTEFAGLPTSGAWDQSFVSGGGSNQSGAFKSATRSVRCSRALTS